MTDPASSAPAPGHVVELTAIESRVLGAMIEKSFTTPDTYPMTTNAIVTACNQKTNRDPVVEYSAVQVDNTLLELRQRNLVRRVHTPGSRATKHRQTLDEQLGLDPAELAVVSVLLLRGPQTVGELRLRTERQHGFDDLESTEACLQQLADRAPPLVQQLARQPGHKEARWQHLLADEAPTDGETAEAAPSVPTTDPASVPSFRDSGTGPRAEVPRPVAVSPPAHPAALEERVDDLEAEVATLRRQLSSLAAQLGETIE